MMKKFGKLAADPVQRRLCGGNHLFFMGRASRLTATRLRVL